MVEINISKINFKGSGNNTGGGGEIYGECLSFINYTETDNAYVFTPINDTLYITNRYYDEWNPSSTSASALCRNDKNLIYAPAIDISNVTNMSNMFSGCTNLVYVPEYNTHNVTNMSGVFQSCTTLTTLNLSNWDTSNVTDMSKMFYSCGVTSLDGISNWNVSNVTNIGSMFMNCTKLTSLDLSGWNVSKITSLINTFYSSNALTSINLSGWNMSKFTNLITTFPNSSKLVDLNMDGAILPNINLTNLNLDKCTGLSVDSLISIMNALPTTTKGYTLKIGSTNLAKLSAEQIAIGTNKGWSIS